MDHESRDTPVVPYTPTIPDTPITSDHAIHDAPLDPPQQVQEIHMPEQSQRPCVVDLDLQTNGHYGNGVRAANLQWNPTVDHRPSCDANYSNASNTYNDTLAGTLGSDTTSMPGENGRRLTLDHLRGHRRSGVILIGEGACLQKSKKKVQEKRERLMTWFAQMMFVSGETAEPSTETTGMIEELVRQQVIEMVSTYKPHPWDRKDGANRWSSSHKLLHSQIGEASGQSPSPI